MEIVTKIAPIALALIMLALGLGLTGQSVFKFLKKNKAKKIFLWDDNIKLRKKFKIQSIES